MTIEGLTIGQAARKLGTTPNTLRAWCRRFGYPPFVRSPGGQRRYPLADIEQLARCLEANGGMVRAAIDEARHSADVFTVCPHCRKQVDRLLVRTRHVDARTTENDLSGVPKMADKQIDMSTWMRDRLDEGKDPVLVARIDRDHFSGMEVTVKLKDEPDLVAFGWTLEAAFQSAVSRRSSSQKPSDAQLNRKDAA